MSVTININNLSLCHKGSNGVSIATVPDVCNTPSPGGPVPIPYPNVGFSKDLVKGTTTVSGDSGQMCANYGSEFTVSTGDEPGSLGGVASGTFIKEVTWLTYSFDVKLEDKGACRLTDKMLHNHHNCANLGGLLQLILAIMKIDFDIGCKLLFDYIERLIGKGRSGHDEFGIRGLDERFLQQRVGGGLGAEGAPNVPLTNPNNDFPKGSNNWLKHNKAIRDQQRALEKALDKYQKCGPPPSGAREWVDKKLPEPSEWVGPQYIPSAGPSTLARVGWGVLAVGLSVAAVGLALCPFDGPVGEVAAGSGASAAWGLALAL